MRRLQSDLADVEIKWGLTLAMHGDMTGAVPHLERAVELEPGNPDMRHALGCALLEVGRRTEAIEQFEETLRLAPNHAGAREELGRLRRAGSAVP